MIEIVSDVAGGIWTGLSMGLHSTLDASGSLLHLLAQVDPLNTPTSPPSVTEDLLGTGAASATTQPGKPVGPPVPWYVQLVANPLFLFALLIIVMLYISSRTKKKEETQRKMMLDQLKKNDRVQTIGGLLGTVVEVREGEVVLKVDETANVKMRFIRSAISKVIEADTTPSK